jgi:hypothetical protein
VGCSSISIEGVLIIMKRLVLAILVVLSLRAAANAQTFRGAINGTVTDPSGAVVPNAAVKATENTTGIDHNTVATGDGAFSFQDIPLGFYKVTVTASGFPVYTVDKVEVTAGTIYTLQVKLTMQQQATTVEVSAAALTLDTTTNTQNMTITSDAVADIPLNGRDFTQLIAVAPGYGGYSVGGFGSLNGTRANQMNWQIDGVDNNDFWHNIPAVNQGGVSGIAGIVLPIDSIDEFSAQTQSNAEAGRNAGGTVNLVIKSGGNDIHGSAYYFNRNEYFAAHSPFWVQAPGKKAPPLRNENYGFSVGGPFIKNKMFFFTSYEKQQYIIGLSGLATEPSTAWQAAALDILANPVCAPVTATCTTRKYGSYAPVTPSSLSNTLLSTLWPSSVLTDPAVVGKGAVPNNFFSSSPSTGYSYNGVAKVDYNISDKHRLFVRWFGGQGSQTAPTGGSPALGTASSNLKNYFEVAPLHVYNGTAVLNSTFTTKLTNQVLFGANYFNQLFHDFNNSFDTKALGLFLSPDAQIHGQAIHGSPNIAIGNFEQIGITPPEGRSDFTYHLTDIASYVTGNHQIRFGGEFRQGHVNEFYHRHGTGSFTFDGSQGDQTTCTVPTAQGLKNCAWGIQDPATINPAVCNATCQAVDPNARALADYLAGNVASSAITVGNIERWVTVNAYNFFGSDSWQVTKKLNLNLGLRYEYFGPLHSAKKDLAVFVLGKGLEIQGNGINNIFPPDRNNFAPRFGFAYQPTAKNDLVVRGGVGVFYDQINMNPFLDYRPGGSRADGLEINPIGPAPASSFGRNAYNWQTVQTGGASVFPGVQSCVDPVCSNVSGLSAYSVSQDFRAPYFFNYNLQVEKSFGNVGVWQIGYVGSQGRKLSMMFDMPIPASGPGSQFGSIIQLQSVGTSNYNSLQTTFKLRSWHGLTSQYSFTWGHALDEMSEYRGVISDGLNRKLDYGNSDFDTRRLFTANLVYDVPKVPWGHGWSAKAINGWQVSSLWNFHTGQPSDELLSGFYLVGNPYGGSHAFSAAAGGGQWWNPAAFAVAGAGTPALARNTLRGPGFGDVDLSVFKNIPITERIKVQLRAEMFNLLNRINLASGPGSVSTSCGTKVVGATCSSSSGFGMVSDTIGDFNGAPGIGPGEAFNMQLAVKVIF